MVLASYHGESGTITIKKGANEIAVGVVKNWEFTAEFEHAELFGQNSIKRQAVARTKVRVPVTVKYAAFSGKLLGSILGTEETDKDIEGSTSTGRTRASILDSPSPPLFSIVGQVTDGVNVFKAKVSDIYFETVPVVVPEDDWVQPELSGVGKELYLEYATVA